MNRRPDYPIPIPDSDDARSKPQRAAQEVAPYNYRADATLPYYERHPEHRPRPISSRLRRRQLIREGW
jgi:hypothetical protein